MLAGDVVELDADASVLLEELVISVEKEAVEFNELVSISSNPSIGTSVGDGVKVGLVLVLVLDAVSFSEMEVWSSITD